MKRLQLKGMYNLSNNKIFILHYISSRCLLSLDSNIIWDQFIIVFLYLPQLITTLYKPDHHPMIYIDDLTYFKIRVTRFYMLSFTWTVITMVALIKHFIYIANGKYSGLELQKWYLNQRRRIKKQIKIFRSNCNLGFPDPRK